MEEKETSTVETETTVTTEKVDEQNTDNESKKEEFIFTQQQFNDALKKEVNRKTKGMPNKEELKAYNEWKESKKTEAEKQAEKEKEYQEKDNKISRLEKEKLLYQNGVYDEEDQDYIIYKVSKMDGEFKDNLKQFLTDNSKYVTTKLPIDEVTKTVDLGSTHNEEKIDDLSHERNLLGI